MPLCLAGFLKDNCNSRCRKTSYCTPAFSQATRIRYSKRPSRPSVSKMTTAGALPVTALKNSACCRLSRLLRLSALRPRTRLWRFRSPPSRNCCRRDRCRCAGFPSRRRLRHKNGGCTHPPMLLSWGWTNGRFPGLFGCHGNGAAVCRHDSLLHPSARDAPVHTAPPTTAVRHTRSSFPTPVQVYLADRLCDFSDVFFRGPTITFEAQVVN